MALVALVLMILMATLTSLVGIKRNQQQHVLYIDIRISLDFQHRHVFAAICPSLMSWGDLFVP
jgi:hypothetical protein